MRKNKEIVIVVLIVLIGILVRLALTDPNSFQNDGSYQTLRQIESIEDNGLPIYEDELSYSGKEVIGPIMYYYILYIGQLIFTHKLLFLLPIITASLSSLVVFLLVKKLTNKPSVAIFSSFLSIFIPIYLQRTINSLSIQSISIPLALTAVYFFMDTKQNNKKSLIGYVITLLLLTLLTAESFILVIGILFYLMILKLEDMKISRQNKELFIFSLFLSLWVAFIVYKKALFIHGPYVIWQNAPLGLIIEYFSGLNLFSIINYIGILPFFCGVYMIYKYTLKSKDKNVLVIISFTISI
jgi:4-amino-4-deoxy-L-arabinose transferase-like glycosyltransferase